MKKSIRKQKAFTMMEVLAVLIIIGLLAGIAVQSFTGQVDKARVQSTKSSLKSLHNAVLEYKLEVGQLPDEEMGLQALVEQPMDATGWRPGGYLETTEVPTDAWGNEFIYQLNPEGGKPFVIISYGADGEPQGEDNDKDLYSTDAN